MDNFFHAKNHKLKTKNFLGGFTLVELLVVVAIIGILSTVVFGTLSGVRPRARDAKRLSDVKQMALTLSIEATSAVGSKALETCTGANALTTTCSGVTGQTVAQKTAFASEFQAFKDPSTPSTACTSISADTCGYSISKSIGGAGAETGNYQICFYLEDYPAAGQLQSLLRAVSPAGNITTGCP